MIVKPAGTGRPIFTISARLAPFPPRSAFWSLSPSEKSKTYRVVIGVLPGVGASGTRLKLHHSTTGAFWRGTKVVSFLEGIGKAARYAA